MYQAIEVDRESITLMGVKLPDLKSLENAASAIGTNMFEGFEPTKDLIQLYVDWKAGHVTESDFLEKIRVSIYDETRFK